MSTAYKEKKKLALSNSQKRQHGYEIWNVRSLYRVGSLVTAAKELSNCKLDLVRSVGGQMGGQWH
jgi:hypothetical protein